MHLKECHQGKHGSREEALQMTRLDVAQHTTVNIGVPGKKVAPPFTYSIGLLQHFGHPEIIITGLPNAVAHHFLNIFRECIKEGRAFEAEKTYTDIARDKYPLVFKPVCETHYGEYLGYGWDYYRTFEPELHARFSALQMIWSDKNRKFPWDAGYQPSADLQPLLFRTEEIAVKS